MNFWAIVPFAVTIPVLIQGCTVKEDEGDMQTELLELTVERENFESGSLSLQWGDSDRLSLLTSANENIEMSLVSGSGSREGTFKGNLKDLAGKDGPFAILFPYYEQSGFTDGVLKGFFQKEQYVGRPAGAMAVFSPDSPVCGMRLSLKNLFGILNISLTGNGESVSKIILRGNNGETMSGEFSISDFVSYGIDFGNGFREIVLNTFGSSPLSAEPEVFSIAVPHGFYRNGISVRIEASDGSAMTKDTARELDIGRNASYDAGEFNFIPDKEPVTDGIKKLHVLAQSGFSTGSVLSKYSYMLFIASLQGLLNAEGKDAVYLQTTNDLDWSDELGQYAGEIVRWGKDYRGMIAELLQQVETDSYVLMSDFEQEGSSWITDSNEEKLAVAASYAAAYQAMILTESIAGDELFSGMECVADIRGKTMDDVYEIFSNDDALFSKDGIISAPRIPHRNVDMALRHRWVAVKSSDDILTGKFFSRIEPLSPRFSYNGPYSSEGLNVRFSSSYDLYALAAGWCSNISTHERMRSKNLDRVVNSRIHPVDYGETDVHYVCILMSDGGNLEYFDKKFRECFSHESFGRFPMSFMMTPALKKYKPVVQDWYMENVASNISFVTSISGLGDIYPSYMSSVGIKEEYGRMTAAAMADEGQSYLAIMDRREDDSWTWDYMMSSSSPIIENIPDCKGVIFLGYAYMWNGIGSFVNGVPVVSVKYSCFYTDGKPMDDYSNPKSQLNVANSIKAQPKNPESPEGYSIILFNANPPDIEPKPVIMDDVQLLVDYLQEDPGIRIVNASQFFELYKKHLYR